MRIELRGTETNKPNTLHAALFDDKGGCVEIPVRKSHFDSLSKAEQLTYVQECAEFHCACGEGWEAKRNARRAAWDADDKAQADAAAEAARQAELAKFIMIPRSFVQADDGTATGIQVTVTHQGHTCSCVIPPDVATAEANARAMWTESKVKADAEENSLAAFGMVK